MKVSGMNNISQYLLKKIDYKIIPTNMKGFYITYKAAKKNKQIFIYLTNHFTRKHVKDYYFKQSLQLCKKSNATLIICANKVDDKLKKYVCHYSDIESDHLSGSSWRILMFPEINNIYTEYAMKESPSYIDTLLKDLRKPFMP